MLQKKSAAMIDVAAKAVYEAKEISSKLMEYSKRPSI
jgi:hypothetical protein